MQRVFEQWKKFKFCFGFSASSVCGLLAFSLLFFSSVASAAYPDSGLETDIAHLRRSLADIQQDADSIATHSASIDSKLGSTNLKLDDISDGIGYLEGQLQTVVSRLDSANNSLYELKRAEDFNYARLEDIANSSQRIATNLFALSTLPLSVSNAIVAAFQNGVGSGVWEPFWAWTNVLLQFAINTSDRNIESHFADWIDPNGYYVFPGMFGGGNYEADWTPSFPSFVSATLGGLYDNTDLSGYGYDWDWQYLFNGKTQGWHDDPTYSNWFWWMSEGVRRQLNVQTNIWASSLENGNRLSALTNMVAELSSVLTYSNNLARTAYDEATHDLTNNLGYANPADIPSYTPDPDTNNWAGGRFNAEIVGTEIVPSFDNASSSISANLSGETQFDHHGGQGLFRVTNPSFKSGFAALNSAFSSASFDGTFEVDLNSESSHSYQAILDGLGSGLRNLYDMAKYLFYVFCVYCEIRYYLSGGKK